jgi:hypothetical protein
MACGSVVEFGVVKLTGTASVEAGKADIKTGFIVYRVKASSTVFSVDRLSRLRRAEGGIIDVRTSHASNVSSKRSEEGEGEDEGM